MKTSGSLPTISPWFLRFFARYSSRYLKRHFHALRLLRAAGPPNETDAPLIVFLNHASWWDPLVCLFLARQFFGGRDCYAPMEETALARYRFFRRLGFFPVEIGTRRGAAQFLGSSRAVLERSTSALFLTPQGRFADVRAPLALAPGLEHLAALSPDALFVPLAIEYSFWEERKPEVLLAFGEARPAAEGEPLAARLEEMQKRLAAAAQARSPNEWKILLRASSGVNRPYDLWRWARARLRGEAFRADHAPL